MLRTAVLLACACACAAHSGMYSMTRMSHSMSRSHHNQGHKNNQENGWQKDVVKDIDYSVSDEIDSTSPKPEFFTLLKESSDVIEYLPVIPVELPAKVDELDTHLQPWSITTETSPKGLHGWDVPALHKALKYFDEIKEIIKFRVIEPAEGSDEQKRYIIIVGTIDGITQAMVHRKWEFYEEEYNARAPGLLNFSQEAPELVKDRLVCVYRTISHRITKLRNIINSIPFKFLCKISFGNCDLLIYTIALFGGEEMKNDLQLLISLGEASRLFLKEYAKTFALKASEDADIPFYVSHGKEYFKKLIGAAVRIRKYLPENGAQCYD